MTEWGNCKQEIRQIDTKWPPQGAMITKSGSGGSGGYRQRGKGGGGGGGFSHSLTLELNSALSFRTFLFKFGMSAFDRGRISHPFVSMGNKNSLYLNPQYIEFIKAQFFFHLLINTIRIRLLLLSFFFIILKKNVLLVIMRLYYF